MHADSNATKNANINDSPLDEDALLPTHDLDPDATIKALIGDEGGEDGAEPEEDALDFIVVKSKQAVRRQQRQEGMQMIRTPGEEF